MPVVGSKPLSEKQRLFLLGKKRVELFCSVNSLPVPRITVVSKEQWSFDPCAFYRPSIGIRICVDKCAMLPSAKEVYTGSKIGFRNWNWPGSTTDRTPYGVLCYELGHHVDYLTGEVKSIYSSSYSEIMMGLAGEPSITSYAADQSEEWFAENFRLLVTNAALLYQLRPKTFKLFRQKWIAVSHRNWKTELGANVPRRIIDSLVNKGAKEW